MQASEAFRGHPRTLTVLSEPSGKAINTDNKVSIKNVKLFLYWGKKKKKIVTQLSCFLLAEKSSLVQLISRETLTLLIQNPFGLEPQIDFFGGGGH